MPLKKGKSKKTISKNISELHKGKTFAKTAKKFGKNKANKQAVAIALSTARKTGKKRKSKASVQPGGKVYEKAKSKYFNI